MLQLDDVAADGWCHLSALNGCKLGCTHTTWLINFIGVGRLPQELDTQLDQDGHSLSCSGYPMLGWELGLQKACGSNIVSNYLHSPQKWCLGLQTQST